MAEIPGLSPFSGPAIRRMSLSHGEPMSFSPGKTFHGGTSLDPEETKEPIEPDPNFGAGDTRTERACNWLHSGWARVRGRIHSAMCAAGVPAARIERFRLCGCEAWVIQRSTDPRELRISANWCHDRWCQLCGRQRARKIRTVLAAWIQGRSLKFVTLTLKQTDEPMIAQIKRLYQAFKALRRVALWRKAVQGGCAILEVKRSKDGLRWNTHLHILLESKFIDQGELSDAWKAKTGDSWIVDIRRVTEGKAALAYVMKYITKGLHAGISNSPALLAEAMIAMRGTKLLNCFGTWRGLQLNEKIPVEDDEWIPLGRLTDILERASHGDADALQLLDDLKRRTESCHSPALGPGP